MSDEDPNPLVDVAKGLGLLFRAARTAAKKLPSKELEEAMVTSAKEVGRALENVAATIEREVFRGGSRDKTRGWTRHEPGAQGDAPTEPPTPEVDDEKDGKKDDGPPGAA
jgi:hypothetical protein